MKTYLRLAIIALYSIIPVIVNAQSNDTRVVEKRPDPSAPVTRYAETPYAHQHLKRSTNPEITSMVNGINEDSLRSTLQSLQNWGSRFLMNDNKKEIATSLMNKFLSYGYTDVKLDSFYLWIDNFGGISDSSWQYNVVCTLQGSSAPDEVCVVGGHWDSFCYGDPFTYAPGVDDNGTAVAATLEIARVMKLHNYQPETTIQFTLYAAEELGLFGSRYASGKARAEGKDIRFMLNMDMISNNPDNLEELKVYQYRDFEWVGNCAADAIERYTPLSVVFPADKANSGSDSYPYWLSGFPSVYFEEITFSPNWHQLSDTLGNCNVPYLAKVTGGALATLADQQLVPFPQDLRAQSSKNDIALYWKPTKNNFVKGFNVYRSETSGGQYEKLTNAPVADSTYHDLQALQNRQYYYVITSVNDSLQESLFSDQVSGARFNFNDTLLVLANLKGNKITADSIFNFYRAVLDTIPFRWHDINAEQKINMSLVSRYRSIFWMSNSTDFEPLNAEMSQCVSAHASNGGNLLFAGFTPAKFWISPTTQYPGKVPETALFRQLFKVDSNDRKIQSMMYRANAVVPDYDTLDIDSLKYMDKDFRGQIYMVDVFTPAPEASVIYRFDSYYDSTEIFGKMKNRPVGLEYMGNDHKSILLSFPLYYLDTNDAHNLIHYVITRKFNYPTGIPQVNKIDPLDLQLFPNPVKDICHVTFKLNQPGRVIISLISATGKSVSTWLDLKLGSGKQCFTFPTGTLAPGLYQIRVKYKDGISTRKMIKQQ